MHQQLELMTMSWTNTDHRENLYRSGRDLPFASVRRKAVASILEAVDLARIQTAQQDIGCALAHVACEYWIHARPRVLTSHLCFRSLGRSPTVALRASHHFECTDPSFSARCDDFGYQRFIGANGRIPEIGSQLPIIIGRSVSLVHFYNPSSHIRSTGCSFIARYWANLATALP